MSIRPIISASILSADFAHLERDIQQAVQAGSHWIHIDVMDGHFVPNLTMGPFVVRTIRRLTDRPLDVHLMIEYPERSIKQYADAGADNLIIHLEASPNTHRTLTEIRHLGLKAGIGINPATSVESLREVIALVDSVLVMTVNPGYSGQKFLETSYDKVSRLYNLIQQTGSQAKIEVDGGVSADNAGRLMDCGAEIFVAASSIFGHSQGIEAGVLALQKSLEKA